MIEHSERRTQGRVETLSQAYLVKRNTGGETMEISPPKKVAILNLSEEGLSFRFEGTLLEGDMVTLDIQIEEEEHKGVTGKVLWFIRGSESFQYGISIQNMSGRFFSQMVKHDNRISNRV